MWQTNPSQTALTTTEFYWMCRLNNPFRHSRAGKNLLCAAQGPTIYS